MKSPFTFGRIAEGEAFVNRRSELKRLRLNFVNNINSVLISPRRWGKSSLVMKAAKEEASVNPELIFVFLDLFRVRSEEDFFNHYAMQVLKASSGKVEEWTKNAIEFIGRLAPVISFGIDPVHDTRLSISLSKSRQDQEDIINLPERIARKKGKQIVICIDEFQNIASFSKGTELQQLLRSLWQHHQSVNYCLYGSKKHMMFALFEKQSMPFYKFGDLIYLEKIAAEHFTDFIQKSFIQSGRSISRSVCHRLIEAVETHPYYVQQLAHIVWSNTEQSADDQILEQSIDDLLQQNSILYREITQNLSLPQLGFLRALADGHQALSSKETMRDYKLGTSANVVKIKNVMISREIIDSENNRLVFLDPVFRVWIIRTMNTNPIILAN